MYSYINAFVCMYACRHACVCVCMYTYIHTHTHIHTFTCARAHTHTYTHTHTHTIHKQTNTHTNAHTRTHRLPESVDVLEGYAGVLYRRHYVELDQLARLAGDRPHKVCIQFSSLSVNFFSVESCTGGALFETRSNRSFVFPSPTLSPTDPVPRGLLTLCPAPTDPVPRGLLTLCPGASSGPQGQ